MIQVLVDENEHLDVVVHELVGETVDGIQQLDGVIAVE